ncbi:MAG: hypothetical protein Q7S37_04040 [bacterium]|nr:hypothetical protein [bacterium]
MEHSCEAAVITCIDFRFWKKLIQFLSTQGLESYDLTAMAGGAKNLVDGDTREMVFRQLDICTGKHEIKKVYLINHIDCGAYGGSAAFGSSEKEEIKLTEDLNQAENIIKEKYPSLQTVKLLMEFDQTRVLK